MPKLAPLSPLAAVAVPGRYGKCTGGPRPVVLTERPGLRLCVVSARRGASAQVAEMVQGLTGLSLPHGPKRVTKQGLALIGTAPDQWLAVAEGDAASASLDTLIEALAGTATAVDQSGGKAVLRVSGSRARAVLAKGCMLDLDPRAFTPGDAATTPIALIDCVLWQLDEAPSYDLAMPSTFATSFWAWLTASAAEFGYEVAAPQQPR